MEMDELTLQLRRAYRLVHGYQQATVDLAREIAVRLGLEFFCWSPVFNDAPGRSRTDITRKWRWDLLPAYSIYIVFTTTGPIGRGSYMLVVWAEADTGFSKLYEETARGEPDSTKLAAPESCETRLTLWHCAVEDSPKTKDSQAFWSKLWDEEWPESPVFTFEVDGTKLSGGMNSYPLSAFRDVVELNKRLDELRRRINKTA